MTEDQKVREEQNRKFYLDVVAPALLPIEFLPMKLSLEEVRKRYRDRLERGES